MKVNHKYIEQQENWNKNKGNLPHNILFIKEYFPVIGITTLVFNCKIMLTFIQVVVGKFDFAVNHLR